MAEPVRPPRSACEDEEGSPSTQVMRFQTMPPTRPARTISSSAYPLSASNSARGAPLLSWMLMTALVTVSATSTDRNAPTRLSTADRVTAVLGLRAPVAIEGAMAFPVSWNPLVKSNARATTTTRASITAAVVTAESCGQKLRHTR